MKLLITGGCGFLGSNLAARAIERGDDVVVFDNLGRYGSRLNLEWLQEKGKFQFVHGDIRNANDVEHVIKFVRPEAVFHLAGQVAMNTSIADPRGDFEVNVQGTINLLEGVHAHAPNAAFLYSSTNKVYGDLEQFSYEETETRYRCIEQPKGFAEDAPLNFHSPYGCSKGAADQYVLDYARMFGLKTAVFRHSSMYGGRQFATYDQGWIGWFCQKALEKKSEPDRAPFTIAGNGKQVRDVLHADDVQRLYFSALQKIDEISGQAFNIGGGIVNSLSLLELFTLLEGELDLHEPLRFQKSSPRQSDQLVFVADISKANKMIGWTPNINARDGIRRTLSWLT